tara:strand:- start:136 stop:315 length:180 start_codon:yes stop_codon:yes gene_type:complete
VLLILVLDIDHALAVMLVELDGDSVNLNLKTLLHHNHQSAGLKNITQSKGNAKTTTYNV